MKKKRNGDELNQKLTHPILTQSWTMGETSSDLMTKWMGSWIFILLFVIFLILWISLNAYYFIQFNLEKPFDPYPFILLNLALSCLAALQAPIILMSQNREMKREKIKAKYNYAVNRKSERGIEQIKKQLDRIEMKIK